MTSDRASLLLGIPTLCRYDLLERLIDSAERGSLRPRGYVIVDNGGRCQVRGPRLEYVVTGENIGVAASWNLILERAGGEPVVIANDDVVLGEKSFEELVAAVRDHPFVSVDGWALFAQSPECVRRVGWYDENFWPAYYEDSDYDLRLRRAGIVPFVVSQSTPIEHAGWSTVRGLGDSSREVRDRVACSERYFIMKWGGPPGRPRFERPFDGHAPAGWTERPGPQTARR